MKRFAGVVLLLYAACTSEAAATAAAPKFDPDVAVLTFWTNNSKEFDLIVAAVKAPCEDRRRPWTCNDTQERTIQRIESYTSKVKDICRQYPDSRFTISALPTFARGFDAVAEALRAMIQASNLQKGGDIAGSKERMLVAAALSSEGSALVHQALEQVTTVVADLKAERDEARAASASK